MSDLPLGFGVAAKATADCRHADPMNIVAFHQVNQISLLYIFSFLLCNVFVNASKPTV
jgi:hypothetical protein